MNNKIVLDEESKDFQDIKSEWFKKAHNIKSVEELVKFIDHLLNDYEHDYGTVVRAISAMTFATACMGATIEGITGFQAGFVMWDFIKLWEYPDNKTGMRLVNYDNMLYPQYDEYFSKVISKATWEELQAEAKKNLEEGAGADKVQEHWQSIIDGVVPFGFEVKDD